MNRDQINYYIPRLEHYLRECLGVEPGTMPNPTQFKDREKDLQRAYQADALLFAMRAFNRGARNEALRGAFQAQEARGRLGGFWGSPILGDAAATLQNMLETCVQGFEP